MNVCFATESFKITGELKDFRSMADSGNVMHRAFCPSCGTPVTSTAEARPHLVFVRAGTLDDPALAAPDATIWTSAAPEWACISGNVPAYPAQIPPVA